MNSVKNFKTSHHQNECKDFDEILEVIGSSGKFQKIFLYAVVCPIIAVYPFPSLSTIFMWDIPDHFCHVPGKPNNISLETCKNLTLPWETGSNGELRHSQCLMLNPEVFNSTIKCAHGWTYNKTDYEKTIPSEFDWVCDKDHYATQCFTYSAVGSAIGSVIFGILADKYGRRPVFFVAAASNLLINTSSLFVAYDIFIYQILQLFSALTLSPVYDIPILISAEISGVDYRGWIFACTWMIWVLGNSLVPFAAMLCRDWFILGCVSSIPGVIILLLFPFVPESPRWLITAGHHSYAVQVISKIAKTNKKELEIAKIQKMVDHASLRVKSGSEHCGKGVWTLFTKKRLAKNTQLLILALTMNGLLYDSLTMNSTHMAGNQFLNYFYLSLIELPGGWVAGQLVEKTGRRWTQSGFFVVCAIFCGVCAVGVSYPGSGTSVLLAALGIKFGVSITSLVASIQSTELFPTRLRSTGDGFVNMMSTMFGIVGPYIVYSGSAHTSMPYVILGFCSIIGALGSACLPETFQQHLPETIEDANEFGKTHKFWSYLPNNPLEKKC